MKRVLLAAGIVALAACSESTSPARSTVDLRAVSAFSASGNPIVTEAEITRQAENTDPTNHWVFYSRNAGTGAFVIGPDTPPEGVGSFQMQTPTGDDKGFLFNYDYIGTALSTIDGIAYDTYRTAGNLQQVTSLNIVVDFNGAAAGGFTTLVFEPVYNTNQGTVASGVWQHWDAFSSGNAKWWSTRVMPGVCATNCFITWQTIVDANPDATILGGFGINQGSGNPGMTAAVDGLTLSVSRTSVTYDFEPFVTASSKASCMNNGWMSVKRADGSSFRNQGDCVSYLNTGR